LSATVTRKDGHHPIIFMQCGPVRHRVFPSLAAWFPSQGPHSQHGIPVTAGVVGRISDVHAGDLFCTRMR
jgi:hypothetical protein